MEDILKSMTNKWPTGQERVAVGRVKTGTRLSCAITTDFDSNFVVEEKSWSSCQRVGCKVRRRNPAEESSMAVADPATEVERGLPEGAER
jgi:hypothetical protein